MHIGLTYDLKTDPTDLRQAEFDPPATLGALTEALTALGHRIVLLGNTHELMVHPQRLGEVELVFNIAEGSHGRCREAWVPTLLELAGVPYVGSDSLALAIGLDKHLCKRLAQASGVATPRWTCVEQPQALPALDGLRLPLIVKPRYEGSGMGLGPEAVVHEPDALRRRVAWAMERFVQPCLIEEFIPFGELTVFLIGNDPPRALPAIQRPLDPITRLSCHVVSHPVAAPLCPVELTPELDLTARRMAIAMCEVIGCRDMARVDLRVDEAGQVSFLEINPLPSFDPEHGLGLIAECLGTTYTHLVGEILEAALLRWRRRAPDAAALR